MAKKSCRRAFPWNAYTRHRQANAIGGLAVVKLWGPSDRLKKRLTLRDSA